MPAADWLLLGVSMTVSLGLLELFLRLFFPLYPSPYQPDDALLVKIVPNAKKVYVSTGRAGTVCVLDPLTGEVLTTIKVGTRPWGIGISPDNRYLYSANGPSDDVSIVDLSTEKEVARVKAGASPWGVVVVPKPQ